MQKNTKMIDVIGKPAMLEQFAEEAAELAKAALKLARIERGENPISITKGEATLAVIEEYTDVIQCAEELGLLPNREQMEKKHERFLARQDEMKKQEDSEEDSEECEDVDIDEDDVENASEVFAELLERIGRATQNRDFVKRNSGYLVIKPIGERTIRYSDEKDYAPSERDDNHIVIRPMGCTTIKKTSKFPYPSGEWIFYD